MGNQSKYPVAGIFKTLAVPLPEHKEDLTKILGFLNVQRETDLHNNRFQFFKQLICDFHQVQLVIYIYIYIYRHWLPY